jgi:hypothetical protein
LCEVGCYVFFPSNGWRWSKIGGQLTFAEDMALCM